MPWSHISWKSILFAMALATGVFAMACGGGQENEPLKLVPEGATLIAEIEVADILEKVDLDSLLDALPDEEDAPQTIDEALDLIVDEAGIDLRDISRAIIFGDLEREDDDDNYFGLIVRGVFDEEGLIAAIREATGAPLSTETYKGRDLNVFGDESDSFAVLTLLNEETLILGSPDAVREVIDVPEGDRDRAEGTTYDAFNDLPGGLIRLALAVPPVALQDAGSTIQGSLGLLGQQDLLGGAPISSLDSLEKLEIIGFSLGQDGDTLELQVLLDFADQESASTVGDLLESLLIVASALAPEGQDLSFLDRVQVDRSGSKLTVSLDLQLSELADLVEGVFTPSQEEIFRDATPSPFQSAERDTIQTAIDVLMVDNSLSQVTAPPIAVKDFPAWT